MFGLPCTLCQLPHLVLAACLILSATRSFRWQAHAQVAFHTLAGIALLVWPQLLHGPMIAGGSFDDLHTTLQRFTAPFHIGFAIFHYCNSFVARPVGAAVATGIVNPVILFSKAMLAGFMLLNKLLTAYLLYEQRARGQHVSQNFLGCSLLVDGIWMFVELYSLANSSTASLSAEIELMCARTRRWIESGQSGFGAQRAFLWIDSAIGFFSALFQFAFAEQMLKIFMYARDFALQFLVYAIISLVAPFQFSTTVQKNYVAQRIASQALQFGIHSYAFFYLGIFAPVQTVPFVLSFFHAALLFVVGQRVCAEQAAEARELGKGGNKASTSTVTTATVTMRSPSGSSIGGSAKSK